MNICIYAATRDEIKDIYKEKARELGELIGTNGHTLIFGGGATGLMGECSRAVLSAGGKVIGIAPSFFDRPGILLKDAELIYTETMRERKALMEEKSDAFIMLPGGMGTFEEFFEILTLRQLNRHTKPIFILNVNHYYDPLVDMLIRFEKEGFMNMDPFSLCTVCEEPEEIIKSL